MHTGTYVFHCMYVYRQSERTTNLGYSENLTSGQIFFKEGLILLVRGNRFSKELFRHRIYTIQYIQNDNKGIESLLQTQMF